MAPCGELLSFSASPWKILAPSSGVAPKQIVDLAENGPYLAVVQNSSNDRAAKADLSVRHIWRIVARGANQSCLEIGSRHSDEHEIYNVAARPDAGGHPI